MVVRPGLLFVTQHLDQYCYGEMRLFEMMDARGLGTDDVAVRTHVVFLHFQASSRIVAIPPLQTMPTGRVSWSSGGENV